MLTPNNFCGKPKVRCQQLIRLSFRKDDNKTLNIRVGIENTICPILLPWNATCHDIEQVVLSLGHPNIAGVCATKHIRLKQVSIMTLQQNQSSAIDTIIGNNTGGTLEYNSKKWQLKATQEQQTFEQYRPRFECHKIVEWRLEFACYHPSLPLLLATATDINSNNKHQNDYNDQKKITVTWAARPVSGASKRLVSKRSKITDHLQNQNFADAANLVRSQIQQSGLASESDLRIFRASIAKLRQYPKKSEFHATVKLNVQDLDLTDGMQPVAMINIGERIAVSYSYTPDPANPLQHNALDFVGLFRVNSGEESKIQSQNEQGKYNRAEKRRGEAIYVKNLIQDQNQCMHLSSESSNSETNRPFVPSRIMNKKTLVAKATVPPGVNSGTLWVSQDASQCTGVVPGAHYVLCYCLHGSLCSIGNIVSVQARPVPVDFEVKVNGQDDDGQEKKRMYCGDGLNIRYKFKYHLPSTLPSDDWIGLYCIFGGEKSALSAQRHPIEARQSVDPSSPLVARVNLISGRLTGHINISKEPLYPGEYQVVLWQRTPAGTIMLASSTILSASLRQTTTDNQQHKRELRIFLSSSIFGCAIDLHEIQLQVLPSVIKLADSCKVSLSLLSLHGELTTSDLNGSGVAKFVQKNLELQNACRPHAIYLLSSEYGPVFDNYSEESIHNYPWLSGKINKMLGTAPGASLVETELVSGLLVPQCVQPELRDGSIVCIQDIAYKAEKEKATRDDNNKVNAALDLKDRAFNASNNMVINYVDSTSLCASLQGHLRKIICTKFPQIDAPSPEAIMAVEMNNLVLKLGGNNNFVQNDNEIFDALSQAFDNYVVKDNHQDDEDGKNIVLPLSVVSENRGCGKSACIARWVYILESAESKQSSAKDAVIGGIHCFVLVTFVGTSPRASSTIVGVMWRVCAELKRRFRILDTMPETLKDIILAFQSWPGRCAQASGLRIVLIFDDVETLEDRSLPYALVKQEETRVGASFVSNILVPLHPEVRIIATMVTQSKAFDATTGLNDEDGRSWLFHYVSVKSHMMDSQQMIHEFGLKHNFSCTEETMQKIEARLSLGKHPTFHGLLSWFHLIELSNNGDASNDTEKSDEREIMVEKATEKMETAEQTAMEMTVDERATWELLQALNTKYPRCELFLCLVMVSHGGLTEHEILSCFRLVSSRDDVVKDVGWTDDKPLRAWLDIRQIVQPYIAHIVCGRFLIPSNHMRRVVKLLIARKGFRFYAGLLLHVMSSTTFTAVSRKCEEKPHLLCCLLQHKIDSSILNGHHHHHRRNRQNVIHGHHGHNHHKYPVSVHYEEDRTALLRSVLSSLFFLVQRMNHPQLGLYVRTLQMSFHEIAFAACVHMNHSLGTLPIVVLPVVPIAATSQQRRVKKKKSRKKSVWSQYFDIHQLIGRRFKQLVSGNNHDDDLDVAPHNQVYAVGKLLQLFNLHEPSASLLRASLLMSMKKTQFVEATHGSIIFKDPGNSVAIYVDWIRSRSLAWKRARLHATEGFEMNQLSTLTTKVLQEMREAHSLLIETLNESSSHINIVIQLKEGKRMFDRFVIETEMGQSLERNSAVLLREGMPRTRPTSTAKEWPQMRKAKSTTPNEEDRAEEFSMFMLC